MFVWLKFNIFNVFNRFVNFTGNKCNIFNKEKYNLPIMLCKRFIFQISQEKKSKWTCSIQLVITNTNNCTLMFSNSSQFNVQFKKNNILDIAPFFWKPVNSNFIVFLVYVFGSVETWLTWETSWLDFKKYNCIIGTYLQWSWSNTIVC